jgi:SAM-dependent methyltransferase
MAWGVAWVVWALAGALPQALAFALATAAGALLAWPCTGWWRQSIAALGFPLSALVLGAAAGLPAWAWLLMLLPLLALYPMRAWQDAPFFPTPVDALQGAEKLVGQPQRVLDAGCGLGDGLRALRLVWPQAELQGVEWSAALVWGAKLRCRLMGLRACVWRADMWATPWAGHDVVYVFQRPESMPRVFAKAARELSPGAWLLSLEFEVPGQKPTAQLQGPGRKPLWLYQPAGVAIHLASRSTPQASSR